MSQWQTTSFVIIIFWKKLNFLGQTIFNGYMWWHCGFSLSGYRPFNVSSLSRNTASLETNKRAKICCSIARFGLSAAEYGQITQTIGTVKLYNRSNYFQYRCQDYVFCLLNVFFFITSITNLNFRVFCTKK